VAFLPIPDPMNEASRASRLRGVHIGIVVDNKEADGNPGYRVKVKLPWLSDADTTYWARIVVPMAGGERGTYTLPEVDDQVLVVFEHGDVSRPIVIGSLWNDKQKPPEKNSDGKNNVKVFKSKSGHRLIVDDKDGAEKLIVVDSTKKNHVTLDSSAKSVTIECADGDILIEASTKVVLHGDTIKIAGTSKLNGKGAQLKLSGSTVDIKAGGELALKGNVTQINTGGGAAAAGGAGGGGLSDSRGADQARDQEQAQQGGGGGGGGGAAGGIDLQGMSQTFSVRRSEVINDIRDLLGLPPEEFAAGQGTVASALGEDENATRAMNSNELSSVRKPKVIWKSDSNTLYIVATRLQHMWVEGYLAVADKPQSLIAIEVKFIETSRDPKREFGIDWTGTLENGSFRQVNKVKPIIAEGIDPETGLTFKYNSSEVEYTQTPTTGGYRADLAPLLSSVFLNEAKGAMGWPALSILSAQDLNVKLRAIMRDEETNTTSYPRMVTLSNREVAIRSVVNQPVLDASSTASAGAVGATTTTQVAYLPIGTVLNILPKRMQSDKVLLNVAVTVSSIIGTEVISGNPYPIASSRVYSAPVEIDSGYTVAVGGLDEAREREGEAGVPFLSKIPGLKWLFNYKSRSKNHKNLMLFITPTIIDARNGGLPMEPQSVVPQRPNLPGRPKVDSNSGALIGGSAALPKTVEYLSREAETLGNTIQEGRITDDVGRKLKELKIAVEQVHAQCDGLKVSEPAKFAMVDQHQLLLKNILDRLAHFHRVMFTKKYL
jgi:type II secretory pathway component GspD/PulD (secretin)/phage baseplate assembly protein gpV